MCRADEYTQSERDHQLRARCRVVGGGCGVVIATVLLSYI